MEVANARTLIGNNPRRFQPCFLPLPFYQLIPILIHFSFLLYQRLILMKPLNRLTKLKLRPFRMDRQSSS
jgi:hypothetical protein